MKKLILSYDYELFFGDKSGTVQKTLIEPTKHLLDSFRKTHLRANFFIDYLMLKKLKEVNDAYTNNDIALIEGQIQQMIVDGHRIELHIHSHWVDAKYLGRGYGIFQVSVITVLQLFQKVKLLICLEKVVKCWSLLLNEYNQVTR